MKIEPYQFAAIDKKNGSNSVAAFRVNIGGKKKENNKKTYSEEELAESKNQGYDEGYKAGIAATETKEKQLQEERGQNIQTILTDMNNRVGEFFRSYNTTIAEQISKTESISFEIAKKIAGDALKENPTENIKTLVKNSMEQLFDRPSVNILVNTEIVEDIKKHIESILSSNTDGKEVFIKGVDEVLIGDCKIEWASGGISLNTGDIIEKCRIIIGAELEKQESDILVKKEETLESQENKEVAVDEVE